MIGVLHAVAVDAGAAAAAVVVDDVVLDERAGDDAVAALADVAVHVDAVARGCPRRVAADDRAVAAVGDVDAVLLPTEWHDVVLDRACCR